ncbi:MAG: YggT family protein [Wenzhouxiangellaceae bacterium]
MLEASAQSATSGLIHTLFQLFLALLMLRFLLPLVRANYFNPVCQFIVRITDPLLKPVRRLIPTFGRFDAAALVLMLVVQMLEGWLQSWLMDRPVSFAHLIVYASLSLVVMLLGMYMIFIIVSAVLSWFGANVRHPLIPLLQQLVDPVLRPIRRVLPLVAGIDFSPLVALIGIQFLIRLLGW